MFDFRKVPKNISKWWYGEVHENDPNDSLVFIGFRKRRWTSQWVHSLIAYFKENHKFIITTAIAIAGVFIALLL